MMRLALLVLTLWAGAAYAQTGAPVNTPTGSVWTYFGPTFGASWGPPPSSSVPVFNVLTSGAVCNGTVDDSTAFNAAATAAGAVGGVVLVPPKRCRLNSTITMPPNTTLWCVAGFGDSQNYAGDPGSTARFGTLPALLLASTASIQASGGAVTIQGCMIQRYGMGSFPVANSTAFAGTALKDNGHPNFTVRDGVILGFGTCIYITGPRPYIQRVFMDCAGASGVGTYGAALEIDNSNTDAGYFIDLKLQPMATDNGACPGSLRPGIGVAFNGINFVEGSIVSQNFQVAQFVVGALTVVDGTLWADYIGTVCGYGSSIGVRLDNGSLHAQTVNINSVNTGLYSNNLNQRTPIQTVFLNAIGQDCIVNNGGYLLIDSLITNNPSPNCGRYLLEIPATAVDSYTWIEKARVNGINGGALPLFHSSLAGTTIPNSLWVGQIIHDKPYGQNIYGTTFSGQSGAEKMVSQIVPTIGPVCTGIGVGGTCVLATATFNDSNKGAIYLTYGTGAAATGEVSVKFPISSPGHICSATTMAGGINFIYRIDAISSTDLGFVWTTVSGSAPAPGLVHIIAYQCGMV